jgi:hypothetical protein
MGFFRRQRHGLLVVAQTGNDAAVSWKRFIIEGSGLLKEALRQPINLQIIAASGQLLQRKGLSKL